MPVPGPRDQYGPDEGYRNPGHELPDRFRPVPYHGIADEGRSPGLMEIALRGCVLAAGQVRRLWRQSVNYTPAQDPYSWTELAPAPGRPEFAAAGAVGITRALRYMTRSVYIWGGSDNSRLSELHTVILPRARGKLVSTGAGQARSRPSVRNRLTSFGSRVEPLNARVQATRDYGAGE